MGIDLGHRVVAWLLAMPPPVVVAFGLRELLGFCRGLRGRGAFTTAAAVALGCMGWTLVGGSVLLPLSRFALALFLRMPGTPGLPVRAFAIGCRPVFGAALTLEMAFIGTVLGLVVVVFAAILRQAARLAEENASFV